MDKSPFTACHYGVDAETTHDPAGISNYNESVYVKFVDPLSEVSALMRIGNRPTMGYSEATVQLTLPGGRIALRAGRKPNESNDEWAGQGLEIAVKEDTRTWAVKYRNTVALINTPSLLAERGRQALKNAPSLECEIALTFRGSVPMSPRRGRRLHPGQLADRHRPLRAVRSRQRIGPGRVDHLDHRQGHLVPRPFLGSPGMGLLQRGMAGRLAGRRHRHHRLRRDRALR
jgi:hypothetical protein